MRGGRAEWVIYFVEGQTEKALLMALQAEKIIPSGKIHIFNCWDGKVESTLRLMPKSGRVISYIVFDTDVTSRVDEFVNAVKRIADSSSKVHLLQQTRNLEEELIHACPGLKLLALHKAFRAQGGESFKNKFIKDKKRLVRLQELGFNVNQMWSRGLMPILKTRLSLQKIIIGF